MLFNLFVLTPLMIIFVYLNKTISKSYQIALLYSIILFLYTLFLIYVDLFKTTSHLFEYTSSLFGFSIGVDGISLWLILLVNLITPILILNGLNNKNILVKSKEYLVLILMINLLSIIVFLALDLFLFYICFEAILIPLYFLIGIFGSRNKKIEANKMIFLYTLGGSLLLLFGIIYIYLQTGTSDLILILQYPFSRSEQLFLFMPFFISFCIKLPVIPLHSWLPNAHTEAPTGGSVILAAILLKFGSYGLLRFVLPLFPEAVIHYSPLACCIAIFSIILASFIAMSLVDLKQIIAYSSIIHMNVSLIGIFSNDLNGLLGSYLYTISHGLIASGLFLLIGVLYERYHTRIIKYYRGLVIIMPTFVTTYLFFSMSNISFPLTAGFVPEILIYFSSIKISPLTMYLTSLTILLLPFYFILGFHRFSYGKFSPYILRNFSDLTSKEIHLFLLLTIYIFILGLVPNLIIDSVLLRITSLLI